MKPIICSHCRQFLEREIWNCAEKLQEGQKPTKCGKDNVIKKNGLHDEWFDGKHELFYENGKVSGVGCQSIQEKGNIIKPLCQDCQQFLTSLNPNSWEKNKLRTKNEAEYCYHDFSGSNFYDKEKKLIIKKPTLNIISTGVCREHGEKCLWKSNNQWGDEEHETDDQPNSPPPPLNNFFIIFTNFNTSSTIFHC